MNAPNKGAVWDGGVGILPLGIAIVSPFIGMFTGEPEYVPFRTGDPK